MPQIYGTLQLTAALQCHLVRDSSKLATLYLFPIFGVSKAIPYSGDLNETNTAPGNFALSSALSGALDPAFPQDIGTDTSSFALRQSSNPTHPHPTKEGGRNPETGLYPSPTHAVRNQFGSNMAQTNSSYDLRTDNGPERFTPPNDYSHGENTAPEGSSARPYTAAQGVIRFS